MPFEKLPEIDKVWKDESAKYKPCLSPEHLPPGHIVLSPGRYKYTCPDCGHVTFIDVPIITC